MHKARRSSSRTWRRCARATWLDRSGYTYGLHGTPTTFTLEERLATLEGGTHAMLVPSGLAAITLVDIALLKAGDQVLLPDNVYGPNKDFTRHELARWGIAHALYDPMDLARCAAALTPATRLVWLEAPGSVTLEFPDLRALVRTLREKAPQAVIALDNTWGAGIAFDAFELGDGLGVDLTIHALTKYPSGGGDVLMGSVICRDDALYRTLALARSRVGHRRRRRTTSRLVLRSLPSLPLRYAAQDAAGRAFAAVVHDAAGVRARAAPGAAGIAGPCALGLALHAPRPACSRVELDARFTPRAGGCLRRRAAAVSHRLVAGAGR